MGDIQRERYETILRSLSPDDAKFLRDLLDEECAEARAEGYADAQEDSYEKRWL